MGGYDICTCIKGNIKNSKTPPTSVESAVNDEQLNLDINNAIREYRDEKNNAVVTDKNHRSLLPNSGLARKIVNICDNDDSGEVYAKVKQVIDTLITRAKEEEREEKKKLLLSVNIVDLVAKMKEDAKEYGQFHDDDCPQMSEWADIDAECDCKVINAMKQFAGEWMGEVNHWWATHAEEHRKLCTPDGNKAITRMLGKKNRNRTPTITSKETEV